MTPFVDFLHRSFRLGPLVLAIAGHSLRADEAVLREAASSAPPAAPSATEGAPAASVVQEREGTPSQRRLGEARARQHEAETEIARLDTKLRSSSGLDQLAALVEQRRLAAQAVVAASSAVTEAVRQVLAERRPLIETDLAKLETVLADATVPDALKATTWREFFARWPVPGAPPEPTGFRYRWMPEGPEFLFDRFIPDLALALVALAPGSFQMGNAAIKDESPVTTVTLTQPFWLGKTEATQAQWKAIMGHNPSLSPGEDLPVENVGWEDAMEFCRKLTKRERAAGRLPADYLYTLPTEAQWEYACRAGVVGDYAGELSTMAWYAGNSGGRTHAVKLKQANAWGLHDMHGNVWEWCLDWHAENLPGGSVTDPMGPLSGPDRVRRGGGWVNAAILCRSANRSKSVPGNRGGCLGFRLALVSSR